MGWVERQHLNLPQVLAFKDEFKRHTGNQLLVLQFSKGRSIYGLRTRPLRRRNRAICQHYSSPFGYHFRMK